MLEKGVKNARKNGHGRDQAAQRYLRWMSWHERMKREYSPREEKKKERRSVRGGEVVSNFGLEGRIELF